MENLRIFLWLALIGSLWISYTTWVDENAPPPPVVVDGTGSDALPSAFEGDLPDTPAGEGNDALPSIESETPSANVGDTVRVRTDVLDVEISLSGGDLVRADLLEYPVEKSDPDNVIRLLDYTATNRWLFQSGLRDAVEGPEPNHLAPFTADASDYVLRDGQDELEVVLRWAESGAVAVTKTFLFRPGQYAVPVETRIENNGGEAWAGVAYTQMARLHNPVERSFMSVDTYSYTGPVFYDGDIGDDWADQTLAGGWYASIQHHFLAAAVPPADDETLYQVTTAGREYRMRAVSPTLQVPAGSQATYTTQFFVGPKLHDQLRSVDEDLDLTVDYGMLTPLSSPLFWLFSVVHDFVKNWGWSIVIVTILIKLAFYKLTAMSGRSMAKMRKLQPRLKALQERYKDDRQALGQAMMDLYKREKVNPAAGCLPMLIQMPFFFAFYWVLVESVEMRQAPFMLWINDLSVRDPFFILPAVMCAAMWFQMRLNPAPPDPVQAKVMQIMPFVFAGMFAFFPAGLVLYWVTNTIVSIGQQWRINQLVEREG